MEGKVVVIGILTMLLFSGIAMATNPLNSTASLKNEFVVKGMKYTAHDVIRINGDGDFDSAHGVVGGSGTQSDPYIISGWEIDAQHNGDAISIGNVSVYFIVENTHLFNTSSDGASLKIYNTTHGIVRNNNCSNNSYGIYLHNASGITLYNNTCLDDLYAGIYLFSTHDITARENTCHTGWGGSNGFQIVRSTHDLITHNRLYSSSRIHLYYSDNITISGNINYAGVSLDSSNYNIIDGESVSSTGSVGIWLSDSEYNRISNSTIMNNKKDGIHLLNSRYTIIENNTISYNEYGIYAETAGYNTIRNNMIAYNTYGGVYLTSDTSSGFPSIYNNIYNNSFYYNNGAGDTFNSSRVQAGDYGRFNSWNSSNLGNYWHDWANNNDTNDQNYDGIVDWPYPIDGGAKDYIPLKNPSQPIPEFPNVEILIPILVILLIGFVWRRRK